MAEGTSVFQDMTIPEMNRVVDYLFGQKELNLVMPQFARVNDSFIYMMETLRPKKQAVLDYIDNGAPAPERAARVIIHRSAFQLK